MSKPKTDTVEVITDKQAALLRELAIDANEPEASRGPIETHYGIRRLTI